MKSGLKSSPVLRFRPLFSRKCAEGNSTESAGGGGEKDLTDRCPDTTCGYNSQTQAERNGTNGINEINDYEKKHQEKNHSRVLKYPAQVGIIT